MPTRKPTIRIGLDLPDPIDFTPVADKVDAPSVKIAGAKDEPSKITIRPSASSPLKLHWWTREEARWWYAPARERFTRDDEQAWQTVITRSAETLARLADDSSEGYFWDELYDALNDGQTDIHPEFGNALLAVVTPPMPAPLPQLEGHQLSTSLDWMGDLQVTWNDGDEESTIVWAPKWKHRPAGWQDEHGDTDPYIPEEVLEWANAAHARERRLVSIAQRVESEYFLAALGLPSARSEVTRR